jgi:anti-sigma-K factor RskA
MNHEEWIERADIYALGALDGDELAQFEAHLSTGCGDCERHLRAARETLTLLPRSLVQSIPPASLKNKVLEQIPNDQSTLTPITTRPARFGWRLGAGALAAGLVGAILTGTIMKQLYGPRLELYTAVINLLRDPSTRDVALRGSGPSPAAAGRFLWNESGEGHLFVANLPAAPQGKMYAVWTIARNLPPRYVGAIKTDASGRGGVHINTARSDRPIEVFAVTLEPAGNVSAPTGPMVLTSN